MIDETGLASFDGDPVSLQSVHIKGLAKGPLLSVTTEQHYLNQTRKNLEVVYTFPLPAHAVILEVNLRIGGKALTAVVMEKSQAEADYEEAIREGDLPVMVERSGPGLYTANLGNLKPGEDVVIEVQWAQLLCVQDRSIRIGVPTVIGKRYGNAHSQGGLAAHQTDEGSLLAQYPLSFNLQIEGGIAHGVVSCPSHSAKISSQEIEGEKYHLVSIDSNAYLDRDVVVNLSGLQTMQFGLIETEPDGTITALASFCPTLAHEYAAQPAPLALKILVDCSGSMEGDSIEQAREAVHQVMQQLKEGDYVSYSRFGSDVAHNFGQPVFSSADEGELTQEMLPFPSKKVANIGRLIRSTKANMGGTEMQAALVSAINDVRLPAGVQAENFVPSILMITDGNIWSQQGVVRAARASGHRIFAIGVGSAPAESLLSELAQSTGGAFALVTPNESITQAALRMVARARCAQPGQMLIDWGQTPVWQSKLPATVFPQESIHVFAQFKSPPGKNPGITVTTQKERFSAQLDALEVLQADTSLGTQHALQSNLLARVAASQRLLMQPENEALETALRYSLVTEQTNLLLVHVREQQDKTKAVPRLEQIKQMMAAGHSGYGSARAGILRCREPSSYGQVHFSMRATFDQPTLWRDPGSSPIELSESGVDRLDIPAFLRRRVDKEEESLSPEKLVQTFNQLALLHQTCDEALENLSAFLKGEDLEQIIATLESHLGSERDALLILLLWLARFRELEGCTLEPFAAQLLEDTLQTLDQDLVWDTFKFLDQCLDSADQDSWQTRGLTSG